jgi:hypothetical protein
VRPFDFLMRRVHRKVPSDWTRIVAFPSWQRKTGKKTYVYIANEAGDVRSNRVIIPAN